MRGGIWKSWMFGVAGVVSGLWGVAVLSLGRHTAGGPGDFFLVAAALYVGSAFVLLLVFLAHAQICVKELCELALGRAAWWYAWPAIGVVTVLVSLTVLVGMAELQALRAERNPSETQLRQIADLARTRRDRHLLMALVKNPACPPDVLAAAAALDWGELREWHTGIRDLIRRDRRPLLLVVAGHRNVDNKTLRQFVGEPPGILAAVAANPRADPSFLLELSELRNKQVLAALALNPSTPPNVLGQLAATEELVVRERVARNRNTPVEALQVLATDPESRVRLAVVLNRNVPLPLLEALTNDPDPQAQSAAKALLERRRNDERAEAGDSGRGRR